MHSVAPDEPLVLRFSGSLVEQLGAQLYPRVTASVAELVSNAWDADARHVWITMPFDDDWREDATIEVLDDGVGMRRREAQRKYLVVGRNRRREDGETSEGGRPLHGRKGIGKLAAFGTAGWLECATRRDGELTTFAIDYEALRRHRPTEDYPVEQLGDVEPLVNPTTLDPLDHGTRVRLTKLRAKRRTPEASFRRSMARRFALDSSQMQVFINGEPLSRFDMDVAVRLPRDGTPPGAEIRIQDGWAVEAIPYPTPAEPSGTKQVRWWLGFAARPIDDEETRGVSVLSRGKLAQRPFMFGSAQGTTGQLGQEYLVGEVAADWLDHGVDADEDLIQSNRDQLQLDNEELQPFLDWGRGLLRWALAYRNKLARERSVGPGALGQPVEDVIRSAPSASRQRLRTLAGRIAEVTQADSTAVASAMRAVVDASDVAATERAGADLQLQGDPDDEQTWTLLNEVADTVRDAVGALLRARIDALAQFATAVNEPPVRRMHNEVSTSPWIISPLLADLPRQTVRSDETVCVVVFAAAPPLLSSLKVVCWAVGVEPDTSVADGASADLVIGSRPVGEEGRVWSWSELLSASRAAHEALLSTLEGDR